VCSLLRESIVSSAGEMPPRSLSLRGWCLNCWGNAFASKAAELLTHCLIRPGNVAIYCARGSRSGSLLPRLRSVLAFIQSICAERSVAATAGRLASLCESSECDGHQSSSPWLNVRSRLSRSKPDFAIKVISIAPFSGLPGWRRGSTAPTLRAANSVQFEAPVQYTNRARPYSCCI
jgi:hypothetical protein